MKYDPNRNAKVIIPLALAAWLGAILAFKAGVPAIFEVVFVVGFAIAIPVVVFYLIGESGWRALARHYRARQPYRDQWRLCATGQMARVSVDHPQFNKARMRFVGGSLRMAATSEALHLATLVSNAPILKFFFPALEIPWSAVGKAHPFEAPGWTTPQSNPGVLAQLSYDPNYTGTFIELEVGQPPVFIQLPAAMLGEGMERLPLEA